MATLKQVDEGVRAQAIVPDTGVTYTEHDLRQFPIFTSDWRAVARTLIRRGFDARVSGDGFLTTDAPEAVVCDVIACHVDTSGT